MQTHFIPRFVASSVAAALFVGVSLLSGAALGQDIQVGPPSSGVLCPHPATLKLTATATPSVNAQDFPNPLPAGQGVRVLGQAVMDHVFRYTFNWKVPAKLCCEITKATLTVKFKWFGPAGPASSGNDTIAITHQNANVPGLGGYIWGGIITSNTVSATPYTGSTVPPTQTKTVIIPMNAAALQNINASNRLSFSVQDDTTVESAVLELSGCCLTH